MTALIVTLTILAVANLLICARVLSRQDMRLTVLGLTMMHLSLGWVLWVFFHYGVGI